MNWSKKEIVLFFFAVFISSSFILLAVKKPALANKGRARAFLLQTLFWASLFCA